MDALCQKELANDGVFNYTHADQKMLLKIKTLNYKI